MSAASPPSVYCRAFGNGGPNAKLLSPRHRQDNFLQVIRLLSYSPRACKLFGYGDLCSHPHYHDRHGLKVEALSSSSKVGACVCDGSPLQFEEQHPCLSGPFSRVQQLTCVRAHSQQHLSLQEDQERLLRSQERSEALKKYRTTILDSLTHHQASLQQSVLLSTDSQDVGVTHGYVPVGLDVSSCCKVFVGNVHHRVSNNFFAEVFSTIGPLVTCRLIRKAKSCYGFVEYQDHHAAAMAISTLNGRQLFKLPIRVNWAFPSEQWEDWTEHHTIFVGSLSIHVTEAALFKSFSAYPSCSIARIIWDPRSGRSRGFGFVSFREREDAVKAIEEMTGKVIGDKAIHCAWAESKEITDEEPPARKEMSDQEPAENKAKKGAKHLIKNNMRYTTVYVGNLARKASQEELQEMFNGLGVGSIEDVQIARDKGYGFVRYSTHEEAALAIQAADGLIICEKRVKCDWGTKPNSLLGFSNRLPLESPEPVEPTEELTFTEG
ncbi:hypothetical protein GOP47_0013411 [Adiantum capillus-veneris]|uniref:RRM domain-containing protein n=1 Tax=Adiantum capillus-veneris TaxID=13818 RepID=A0A9D4UNG3_ADICA|nr:hypothetical protein GOP47_0013411 [Adiantum capillus-veneris]